MWLQATTSSPWVYSYYYHRECTLLTLYIIILVPFTAQPVVGKERSTIDASASPQSEAQIFFASNCNFNTWVCCKCSFSTTTCHPGNQPDREICITNSSQRESITSVKWSSVLHLLIFLHPGSLATKQPGNYTNTSQCECCHTHFISIMCPPHLIL